MHDAEIEEPHPLILDAIYHAIRAGVFRRAQRLNPTTGSLWEECAEPHSQSSREFLAAMIARPDERRSR